MKKRWKQKRQKARQNPQLWNSMTRVMTDNFRKLGKQRKNTIKVEKSNISKDESLSEPLSESLSESLSEASLEADGLDFFLIKPNLSCLKLTNGPKENEITRIKLTIQKVFFCFQKERFSICRKSHTFEARNNECQRSS